MTFYIATFDIGTSAVKAALADSKGNLSFDRSIALQTYGDGGRCVEQEAEDWFRAVQRIAVSWWHAGVEPRKVSMIAISGQMQDFLPLDRDYEPLHRAVLYSDGRAVEEAREVNARYGEDKLWRKLENSLTPASILPKLLRWRAEFPQDFKRLRHLVLGAKDYVTLRLTGQHVTDRTNASTTGLYLPKYDCWDEEMLADYGIPLEFMPQLRLPQEQAGPVSDDAAEQTGFMLGTPVLCGVGDAGAATLGAGVLHEQEAYLYLGTTGWLARLESSEVGDFAPDSPVFKLAAVAAGQSLRVAPVLNAGNVLNWALTLIGHQAGENTADYFQMLAAEVQDVRVSDDLQFIPYLHAERCPIISPAPCGALLGLTAATSRAQILQAVLEGTALSLRWCADLLDIGKGGQLKVVGGGARCAAWMQAIADHLRVSLLIEPNAHLLPLRGLAALAAVEAGWSCTMEKFLNDMDRVPTPSILHPRSCDNEYLRLKLERFKHQVEWLQRREGLSLASGFVRRG